MISLELNWKQESSTYQFNIPHNVPILQKCSKQIFSLSLQIILSLTLIKYGGQNQAVSDPGNEGYEHSHTSPYGQVCDMPYGRVFHPYYN